MPCTAVLSTKVVPVISGEAGVMSVDAAPMPRNTLYRTAPVEATHVTVTLEMLLPLVADTEVGALRAR